MCNGRCLVTFGNEERLLDEGEEYIDPENPCERFVCQVRSRKVFLDNVHTKHRQTGDSHIIRLSAQRLILAQMESHPLNCQDNAATLVVRSIPIPHRYR